MEYWEEQQLKQSGYFEEEQKTVPDPKYGQPALEGTLNNIKETLWDVERHTGDTQSRLDKNNQSGPSHYAVKISKWSAENWILDMISETLVEIQDTLETSSIARHSDSPLEESIAKLQDSTVSFNEKTLRWHDDQTNLMVKGSDPRVATAMKASSKKTGWEALVTEHRKTRKLLGQGFFGKKSKGKSAEEKDEAATDAEQGAENEEKQTSFLSKLWENSKESKKGSWLAENWGKMLIGVALLLAPLKHVVKLWDFLKDALKWSANHPLLAAIAGLSLWFMGGPFLKLLGTGLWTGLTSLFGAGGAAAGGVGLITKLFLGVKAAALGGLASPLAIVGAMAMAIWDGFSGYLKSSDWGVSGIAGFLGGFFAGDGNRSILSAFKQMGKYAILGATLGSVFPVVGTIVGGVIGAVVGAIMHFIGGKRIAQAFQNIFDFPGKLMEALGLMPMINDFLDFFSDMWYGFKEMLSDLFGFLGKIPEKLGEAFNWLDTHTVDDVVEKFKEWGKAIIGMLPEMLVPDSLLEWAGIKPAKPGSETSDDTTTDTDDTDTNTLEVKKQVLRDQIAEQEKEIAGGDERTWRGQSRQGIIDKASKELMELGADDRRHRTNKAELAAKKGGAMSFDDYIVSERGVADRTEGGELVGKNKEEQLQLYEKFVAEKTQTAPQISTKSSVQSAVDNYRNKDKPSWSRKGQLLRTFKGKDGKTAFDALTKKEQKGLTGGLKAVAIKKGWLPKNAPLSDKGDANAIEAGFIDGSTLQANVSPDIKMNTFNSIQKENLAARNQPSSPVVMTAVDQSKTVAPFEQNLMMEDKLHNSDIPVGVNQ